MGWEVEISKENPYIRNDWVLMTSVKSMKEEGYTMNFLSIREGKSYTHYHELDRIEHESKKLLSKMLRSRNFTKQFRKNTFYAANGLEKAGNEIKSTDLKYTSEKKLLKLYNDYLKWHIRCNYIIMSSFYMENWKPLLDRFMSKKYSSALKSSEDASTLLENPKSIGIKGSRLSEKNASSLKKKQRELMKKLGPPKDIRKIISGLRESAWDRFHIRVSINGNFQKFELLLKEIKRRTKASESDWYYFSHKQIIDFLANGKIPTAKDLKRNRGIVVFTAINGKAKVSYSKKAEKNALKILNFPKIPKGKNRIEGLCASSGKARGKACIILNIKQASRLEKDDILVTTMTHPDYVPLMKKASAIITDEGGISCHAAIVSRELKKPCIVGTTFASRIIREGDLVEVNATEGYARIISRGK